LTDIISCTKDDTSSYTPVERGKNGKNGKKDELKNEN
jgi:hypothetical protein